MARFYLLFNCTLAVLMGCQASLPASRRNTPSAHPPSQTAGVPPVLSANRVSTLGAPSVLAGNVISNNGGSLGGTISLPATLIGDAGGGLISDQGGNIIGNNGGSIIANNGGGIVSKAKYSLTASTRRLSDGKTLPLAGVTVLIVDAANHWIPNAKGQPYQAVSNAQGQFRFSETPSGANLLLQVVGLPIKLGTPQAFLPHAKNSAVRGDRLVNIDGASSVTMAYIINKYVKGEQAILDKLPGEVEAETRRKLIAAAGDTLQPTTLDPSAVIEQVDALRAANDTLNAQVHYVESLLVAGQQNLGDGRSALEVALAGPHRMQTLPDGSLVVTEVAANRIRRIDPRGIARNYAGKALALDLGDGGPAIDCGMQVPTAIAGDREGNLFICDYGNHRIRRIDARTGIITTIAGNRPLALNPLMLQISKGNEISAGARATDSEITYPHAIAVDAEGRPVFGSQEGAYRVEHDGTLTPLRFKGNLENPVKLTNTSDGQVYACFGERGFARLTGDDLAPATDIPPTHFSGDWHLAGGPPGILYMFGDGFVHVFKDGQWNHLFDLAKLPPLMGLCASEDSVWVCSEKAGQIWRYALKNGSLERFAGVAPQPGVGVSPDELSLNRPSGIAFDALGRLLVADGLNGLIWRRDQDGLFRRVVGSGSAPDAANIVKEGLALDVPIGMVSSLLPDASGGLAFCEGDKNTYRFRQLGSDGKITTVNLPSELHPLLVAKDAQNRFLFSDTVLAPLPQSRIVRLDGDQVVELVPPKQLAAYAGLMPMPDGSLIFADVLSSVVYQLSDGKVTPLAGDPNQSPDFGGDGGPATSARLNFPIALTLDNKKRLYIADSQNNRIRQVDLRTGIINTVAGVGSGLFEGENSETSLLQPSALAFDAEGNLFIADTGHNQIKRIPKEFLEK